MSGCCDPRGCDKVFGPKMARRFASSYRRKGLDRTARRMVDWLVSQGIEGGTVLEIGGGVGGIQLELLKRGAARTTNVELSSSYESDAVSLARQAGFADRVDRRLGDIAADGSVADSADAVVLHRVVCCYPDADRLVSAAADHGRRFVVFSHPPRNALTLFLERAENVLNRALRREYRAFAHRPEAMIATLRDHGFTAEALPVGFSFWRIIVAMR